MFVERAAIIIVIFFVFAVAPTASQQTCPNGVIGFESRIDVVCFSSGGAGQWVRNGDGSDGFVCHFSEESRDFGCSARTVVGLGTSQCECHRR
jgi:hypothetical protein